MRGQKDLRSMKKGVSCIENQGENWYKMLKNLNNPFVGETLDQLYVQVSLELNVIETNRFLLYKWSTTKIFIQGLDLYREMPSSPGQSCSMENSQKNQAWCQECHDQGKEVHWYLQNTSTVTLFQADWGRLHLSSMQ